MSRGPLQYASCSLNNGPMGCNVRVSTRIREVIMLVPTRKRIVTNTMTWSFPNGNVIDHTSGENTAITGFIKPDKPVINVPDEYGYRKPSPYACPWYGELFIVGEVNGHGVNPNDPNMTVTKQGDYLGSAYLPILPKADPNLLRMKILNNIKDEVLDIAMVLAEMKSTTDMLSGALLTLGRSLKAVKDRKPQHFSYLMHGRRKDDRRPTDKFLRETAGVYLQWKYGITPTLLDIQGASRALDMNEDGSFFDNPPLMVARSSVIEESKIGLQVRGTLAGSGGYGFTVPCVLKREQRARCDYMVTGEGLRGLNRYGLGLGTVATVLWDKKPFSFVLDMAFPLADMIKAWTALGGVSVKGYSETFYDSITHKERTINILRDMYIPETVIKIEKQGLLGATWERGTANRPPFPVPFLRNPIKAGNIATVLSLFTQLRKP